MMQEDTEIHIFMDTVLGHAKKVLFPEADDARVGVSKKALSLSTAYPNERQKAKSRARLATSESLLATIPSGITDGTGSVALRVSAHAVGEGKENRAPKTSGKRGKNIKMDSLAMEFPKKGGDPSERFVGVEIGNRKHLSDNVTQKSKGKGLSYSKIDVNANNVQRHDRWPHISRDDSVKTVSRVSMLNNPSSAIMLQNESTRTKSSNGKARQSNESKKDKSKRCLGPSSLMMLPSSTQKARNPTLSSYAMDEKKPASRRTTSDRKCGGNHLPLTSNPPSLGKMISSDNVNVATLSGTIDKLSIVSQAACSTPLSSHRNRSCSITSPPGFLHRLSKLSNPTFFQDHSPLPDSNPNSMKRFDGKKTPDNKSGVLSIPAPNAPCSITSVATISFSPLASEEESNNESINYLQGDEDQDFINRFSSVANIKLPSSYDCCSNKLHEASNDIIEHELVKPGASPNFIKRIAIAETNPTDSMYDISYRNDDAATREEQLPNVSPPLDLNASAQPKDKPTKRMPPARPRVLKKAEETSTEVRRSARSSKPTDRLTVQSWTKKKKSVQSDINGSKDEVDKKTEKPLVRSGKKWSIDKVTKDKYSRTVKEENRDEDVENGADWESYQSYIQSLLTRSRQSQS